ncbi:DNA recombination protein RmuC [Desulfuromonas thiophila]|uniref:DNA recombination protein RmuC n=1 Tax=Desulfuromonas thiophila TaxID=57664 RepID=A0A1G7DXN4_9BACT|nr:DNA recombination protein RmuC [Desulfuromonas thiophila]SDE55906.1 DNA recombination protein RmuC [Desulfuromonas thiophila]
MIEKLLWIACGLSLMATVFSLLAMIKSGRKEEHDNQDIQGELRAGREEALNAAKTLREEITSHFQSVATTLTGSLTTMGNLQLERLGAMTEQLKGFEVSNRESLEKVRNTFDEKVKELQGGNENKITEMRITLTDGMKDISTRFAESAAQLGRAQKEQLEGMSDQLRQMNESNQSSIDRVRRTLDERVGQLQENNEKKFTEIRGAMAEGLNRAGETIAKSTEGMADVQKEKLEGVTRQLKELNSSNQQAIDRIRSTLDERVKELQYTNEKKLDEMRKTVDEKLHDTLEKRLGESFKLVSDRLEAVHKGLGEMQGLANGVGDLKRVLTNVKARGTWAEVQLGAILDQILTPNQYDKNVCVKPETAERVEFAVRLPGSKDDPNSVVYLPIDSKFPQEDYARLQDAADKADPVAVQTATDALLRAVKGSAKEIHDKYINPPATTDFAILFLPTEGLYAEVLRQPSIVEDLQHNYRIVVAGPTNLVAILSSLRVGFQTLAIEQRASEVWRVLAAVKTEFGRFGEVLSKVKKQLNTASKTINDTEVRTRAMERKLRSVEQLPESDSEKILNFEGSGDSSSDIS